MAKEIQPIEFKSPRHKGIFLEVENKKAHKIKLMENIRKQIGLALMSLATTTEPDEKEKLQEAIDISLKGLPAFLTQIEKDIIRQKEMLTKKSTTTLDALNSELLITLKLKKEAEKIEPTPIFMKIFDSFIRSFTATIALTNTLVTGQRAA